ncbi:MAG: hypothetical protein HY763_05590 [Planctomycetes bacterium]|nr:hypothetical protein [Planctomycetota bacterium]
MRRSNLRERTWGIAVLLGAAGTLPAAEFYHSSFEGTDGGWTRNATWDSAGDWERGMPAPGPFAGCTFGNGPGAAIDGVECWATQIDACYTNANGTSFLRQTFDFSTVVNGTLSWRQFRHVFVQPGDTGVVKINGDQVYALPFVNTASAGWELITVDLIPYSGLPSVEIVFEFFATSSTNGPGWYLDDMVITTVIEPNPGDLGLLVGDNPDPVTGVGDPVVYSVTAVNHGDSAASSVVISGMLDPDTVFNAALSDPAVMHDGASSGGAFGINVGNMPRFSARTFAVAADTRRLGVVSMSTTITSADPDPNSANNTRMETTTTALIPDLLVRLTSDQDPAVTEVPLNYTLRVSNLGPSDATNVAWQVNLPVQAEFVSSNEGAHDGASLGGVVSGVVVALDAGSMHQVEVRLRPIVAGSLVGGAAVATTSPDERDPDLANNAAMLTLGHVDSTAPFARPELSGTDLDPAGGHPPGIPDRNLTFFARPYTSPDGNTWGVVADLESLSAANNQVLILVTPAGAQTVIYENVTALPDVPGDTVGNMNGKISINDAGCYAFAPDAASNNLDVVIKGCGNNVTGGGTLAVVARTNKIIPGDLQNRQYILPLRDPQIDNNGVVRFVGKKLISVGPTVIETVAFETPDDGQTVTQSIRTGLTIPANQAGGGSAFWEAWDQEFGSQGVGMQVTGDGMHMLLRGDLTGATTMDDVLVVDNSVVLQEGVIADPGSTSPANEPAFGAHLAPNGDWYARGRNADGQEWVIRNGAVVARGGDPIIPGSAEFWATTGSSPRFFVVAGDAAGNYLVGGATDLAPRGVLVYHPAGSRGSRGNGARVVSRSGDPMDTDGNGRFDNDARVFSYSPEGAVLLANGTAMVLMSVEHPIPFAGRGGTPTVSVAVSRVPLKPQGACCFYDRRGVRGSDECDDPYTEEECDDEGGVYRGDGSECRGDRDGDGLDELCESCSSARDASGAACDDNDPCTDDLCGVDGFCLHTPRECDDGVACTRDYCDSDTGQCVFDDGLCEFCLYKVECIDGSCGSCSVGLEGQTCREQRVGDCNVGTCQGAYRTTCGSGCCVELTPAGCGLPAGRPMCPDFIADCTCSPQLGACCLFSGGCQLGFESQCTVGTYMGDGTQCGPTQACCDGSLQCVERPRTCCEAEGKPSFPTPCSAETESCETAGGCLPGANLTCCNRPFEACCLLDGSCDNQNAACCVAAGGVGVPGESCSAATACCLPDGTCATLDPACCTAMGGTPRPGGQCSAPERCCSGATGCTDVDPVCCAAPRIAAGPGTCSAPQACCDPFIGCLMDEPACCQAFMGASHDGETCGATDACCLPDGSCAMLEPFCCSDFGGFTVPGGNCGPPEACCGLLGGCQNLAPVCCNLAFGVPTGPGLCDPPEACCIAGQVSCIHEDPFCCVRVIGGAHAGTGSFCSGGDTCPIPEPQACCFGDGTCQDLIPTICHNQSGIPRGFGTQCEGDGNNDDEDDQCREPGDADGDGEVTCDDAAVQVECLKSAGPGTPMPAGGGCVHTNMNADQSLDLRDVALLYAKIEEGCPAAP